MRPTHAVPACALVVLGACKASGDSAPSADAATRTAVVLDAATQPAPAASADAAKAAHGMTPNRFYSAGLPTFITGTAGDARVNAATRGAADMIRREHFPKSDVKLDTAVDLSQGPKGWPEHPVVLGGPHVNKLVAGLAGGLPFSMEPGKLTIGGQVFEGDDIRLVTVIPAGPKNPPLLLYASTGNPGVQSINTASAGGNEPIVISDVFGTLTTGDWKQGTSATFTAELKPRAPRAAWRTVERDSLALPGGHPSHLTIRFLRDEKPDVAEDALIAATERGVSNAVKKLGLTAPAPLTFYIYPDAKKKQELMGDPGNGLAYVWARSLHVMRFDPSPGGGYEGLATHEATHAFSYEAWGPAGTTLANEGLAVWSRGSYQDKTIEQWQKKGLPKIPIDQLLDDVAFRKLPEPDTYPRAGLLVGAAIKRVGLPTFVKEIYPASRAEWEAACARSKIKLQDLEADVP